MRLKLFTWLNSVKHIFHFSLANAKFPHVGTGQLDVYHRSIIILQPPFFSLKYFTVKPPRVRVKGGAGAESCF